MLSLRFRCECNLGLNIISFKNDATTLYKVYACRMTERGVLMSKTEGRNLG